MTQRNEPKIKVLETETLELCEHKSVELPSKIEINGQLYKLEVDHCSCHDAIGCLARNKDGTPLSLEQLQNVRLKEIPDLVNILCEAPLSLGQLRLCPTGFVELEIIQVAEHYRGYFSIECYFEILKKVASKNGFEIIHYQKAIPDYFIIVAKKFPKEATVSEVYKAIQPMITKIRELESKAEESIKSLLESLAGRSDEK